MDKYTRNRDYQFMSDIPEYILKRKSIRFNANFAYMSGVTRDEGSQVLFSDEELRKRSYRVDHAEFHRHVKEYVKIYNYTLDQKSLINAVSFMYSPWSDPNNETLMRQGLIDVS